MKVICYLPHLASLSPRVPPSRVPLFTPVHRHRRIARALSFQSSSTIRDCSVDVPLIHFPHSRELELPVPVFTLADTLPLAGFLNEDPRPSLPVDVEGVQTLLPSPSRTRPEVPD